eukprot:359634-Chlamydomonas_euryale.AAC.2
MDKRTLERVASDGRSARESSPSLGRAGHSYPPARRPARPPACHYMQCHETLVETEWMDRLLPEWPVAPRQAWQPSNHGSKGEPSNQLH